MKKIRDTVLIYIISQNQLLLGKPAKHKEFRYLNGYGGGIEIGENAWQAAVRELQEEAGLFLQQDKLNLIGRHNYTYSDKDPEKVNSAFVFYTSIPRQEMIRVSDEMVPFWFDFSLIPKDKMWKQNSMTIELVLREKYFDSYFILDSGHQLISAKVNQFDTITEEVKSMSLQIYH